MCPKGDVCGNCGKPAIVYVFWPAWHEKFCQKCLIAIALKTDVPPIRYDPIPQNSDN